MILSEISTVLKNKSSLANITQQELKALVKQYPFSSTLKLLQASKELETEMFDQSNEHNVATYTATSNPVIDTLFSLQNGNENVNESVIKNENPKTNENQSENVDKNEDVNGVKNGVGNENPKTNENQNENVVENENADNFTAKQEDTIEHVDSQENENLDENLTEEKLENDTQDKLMLDSQLEHPQHTIPLQTAIPELNHLSDYSSWLLQLKQPKDFEETIQSEQSQQSQKSEQSQLPKDKPQQQKPDSKKDKSSELNKEIVSESLANLLAEQGHLKKATDMYRKLSLIIPEKSAYFAAQIEKIKGK